MRAIDLVVVCFAVFASMAGSAEAGIIINEVNIGDHDWIELFNYDSASSVDIGGYVANIRDDGFGSFDFTLPSTVLAPNSGIAVVAESPLPGEIGTGQNIPWLFDRNLSLTLRDATGKVVDFWAHGSYLYGAPAGVTFSPAPLLLLGNNDSITYQRVAVTSSGSDFFASDWTTGIATRNELNANQVRATVPEPSSLALCGIGVCLAGIGAVRRRTSK